MEHPYLTSQLFAYIGNKRALLPFLEEQFDRILYEIDSSEAGKPGRAGRGAGIEFYDPFAGTGAASRLARLMGMNVHSNDWEYYSSLFNGVYIRETAESADALFAEEGGLATVLDDINRRGADAAAGGLPPGTPAYISAFYAPPDTEHADYRKHRLFYTAENARFIDTVRHIIDLEFAGGSGGAGTGSGSDGAGLLLDPAARSAAASRDRSVARPGDHAGDTAAAGTRCRADLLTALLLYEAGTHANTSGVFKAYHKGFGGLGGDALGRIMRPMSMKMPVLPSENELPGGQRCMVSRSDAAVASGRAYDLVYLDPPYNGHQYGSNYFMLNTIARWDRPDVDQSRGDDGRFRRKAAIREDWTETRSDFCYESRATRAFTDLLANLDSPRILLSYNTEGIIPFDELTGIMADQGRLRILTRDYTTYRGGRQSSDRKVRNMEFILYLDRTRESRHEDLESIRRISAAKRLERLSEASFYPRRVPGLNHHTRSIGEGEAAVLQIGELGKLPMPYFFEFSDEGRREFRENIGRLDIAKLEEIGDQLEEAAITSHIDRADIILDLMRDQLSGRTQSEHNRTISRNYIRTFLWSLNKFAFRKYRREFSEIITRARALIAAGELPDFSNELKALENRVKPRLVREY